MSSARLRLFGTAQLETDDERLIGRASRRYPLALLALLATARDYRLSRSKLIALLWPEAAEDSSRNRLSTYVHHIRNELGNEVLRSQGDHIVLNTNLLPCDVCSFREAIEAGDSHSAVGVYAGPFLDGFHLERSVQFEMRTDHTREQLRRDYRRALEAIATEAEKRQHFRKAADRWHELVDEDPYDSRIVGRLIESLVRADNLRAAFEAAETHRALLKDEIGIEPPESFAGLVRDLKADPQSAAAMLRSENRPAAPSIAVLPFRNSTGTDEAQVLVEGIHGDVLTELSRLPALEIIARTSVMRYRGGERSVREIARDLDVQIVVQGDVQQEGRRVRLRIEMIDAGRETCLWAERFDRELSREGVFGLQSQLTQEIAGALKAELSAAAKARLDRIPTTDLEAYRLYVRGRTRLEPRTQSDLKAAAELFRGAIARDPNYGAAWAGLADALGFLVSYFHVRAPSVLDEALSAARRATRLDPELPEGYAALGLIHMDRKDGPAAVRALHRAIELSPSFAQAHAMLGWVNTPLGRFEEAWRHLRKAERLNPMLPEIQVGMAYGFMLIGYPADRALRHARRAQELAPGYAVAYLVEGGILTASGRPAEGALAVERGLERSSSESRKRHLATLVYAYHVSGQHDLELRALTELEASDAGFFLASAYAALGRIDEAFAILQEVDWTAHHAAHLRCDSALDSLRTDPRYMELLRKANQDWGLHPDGTMPDLALSTDGDSIV